MDNKLRMMRTQHMRCGNAIFKVIRRSFLLAGLCILTDVAIGLLLKIIHNQFPEAIFAPLAMYDINLIINLLCIIATFRDCNVMLFPWLFICSGPGPQNKALPFAVSSLRLSTRYRRTSERQEAADSNLDQTNGIKMRQLKTCDKASVKLTPLNCRRQFDATQKLANEVAVASIDEDCSRCCYSEKANTDSVVAELQREMESESNHYSDTILHLPRHHGYQQKRSASLNLTSHVSIPIVRRAKSHILISLLNKSKSWIIDHKPF